MKTSIFIFWISLLVLFPHGLFSKSPTNEEQYSRDSENSEVDLGNEDVAVHDSFRPRHKYKSNGRQSRFYRSESDRESKATQCAVMYKENEPVGILEPFKDSYRFLPVSGESTLVDINPVSTKRKTIMDMIYPSKMDDDYNGDTAENNIQFADDRYPSIFAKFKIDSRLDKNINSDLNMKRAMYKRDTDKPDISDENVSNLKTTLSKMKEDNSAVVEEELKNILDDMGLIDDYEGKDEAKREVEEDENMEQGANKINMVKEVHNETRNKRADTSTIENEQIEAVTTSAYDSALVHDLEKARIVEQRTEEAESIDLLKDEKAKLKDDSEKDADVSTELSMDERKKREFEEASKDAPQENLSDLKNEDSNLVKETELTQYEKRVEREIRDKIQKLKDEVKEEIKYLKNNPKTVNEDADTRRKKRQVINTLIDGENRNIDPNLNDDQNEERHIRRKRHLDNESNTNTQQIKHLRRKRNANFNDVTNIEGDNKIAFNIKDTGNNDLCVGTEQKIDDADGLRFIINFGEIDPKIKKHIMSNLINEDGARYEKKDVVDKNTIDNTILSTVELKNETKSYNGSDPNYNATMSTLTSFDSVVNNSSPDGSTQELSNQKIHPIDYRDINCPLCNNYENYKDEVVKDSIPLDVGKSSRKRVRKRSVLKVNGKKKYRRNSENSNRGPKLIRRIINKIEENRIIANFTRPFTNISAPVPSQEMDGSNHTLPNITQIEANSSTNNNTMNVRKLVPLSTQKINESTQALTEWYDIKIDNTGRFIGVNPVLENTNNSTSRFQSRNLKQVEDKSVSNIGKEIDIRFKKSSNGNAGIKSKASKRRKREIGNDSEENSYQYDDPEFNEEEDEDESQMYVDQPYAADNLASNLGNSLFSSNAKTTCNCDKTGGTCKCGNPKTGMNVPNIKQDYLDYVVNPNSLLEKKSVRHCNCDKNGKNCKCSMDEGSENLQEHSDNMNNDGMFDDLQAKERTPRRLRQTRRRAEGSMDNSNVEDSFEDYYDNYDTENGKLRKREAKPRKLAGNQQFQNGEYFVDLHPDVYRLTPVETSRKKRDNFKDVVAIHGGGPVVSHLVAIKQRSMVPHSRFRRRVPIDDNREPRHLIDMSDEDLFGALPQSFAGELTRYKRVKRGKTGK